MRIKNIPVILLAALSTAFSPCLAQEPSPLIFSETEWDFGSIREDAGVVGHTFKFTNKSSAPIAIDRINTSCGCTTPEYTRQPVPPGGEAHIKVSFDPAGYPFDFTKSIHVVSGGGKFNDRLIIRGHVTPRVKTVEE